MATRSALPTLAWVCSAGWPLPALPQAGIMLHPADDRLAVVEDCLNAVIVPERGRNPGGAGAKRSLEAGLHRNSMHPRSTSAWGACLIRCSPSAALRGWSMMPACRGIILSALRIDASRQLATRNIPTLKSVEPWVVRARARELESRHGDVVGWCLGDAVVAGMPRCLAAKGTSATREWPP